MRRALALLPLALVAASCGGGTKTASTASATVPPAAPAAKPTLRVSLTAQSHHPQLGHAWTYTVRVTDPAGKPVACRVHLQFLYGGMPVGEVGRHALANGVWKETIPAKGKDAFPPASVGQPLLLRATATAAGYRAGSAGWKVQVVR